jgi:heavy metal sensor kinase
LWGLLLLGTAQIIVSLVLYAAISGWLEAQVNRSLLLTATQVSSVLYDPEDSHQPLDIADVRLQLADHNIATQSYLRDQLFFVRLIDLSSGAILASSVDYAIPVTPAQLRGTRFDTLAFPKGDDIDELRVYSLHLTYAPQIGLQVGVSLEETREIQRDVRGILIVLLLFTGTVAPLSGWFLANRALVPIRATARTAAEINETGLSRRLDLAASEIELEVLAQTFNAMLDRIEQAFQRQRQFTADAAHELRTPLSIMRTHLEVTLSQPRGAADYYTALLSLQEEVQGLSHLANSLLSLARADTNDLPLEIRDFDLSLMLNAVVDQFRSAAEDKGIALSEEIAPHLRIEGDEDRLIQVVYNLIDNAVKYTPDDGQVRLLAQPKDQQVAITIEDTGPGIPDTKLTQIFERFYRLDSARNRAQGGFGLGLAIAKRIVDLHGGAILVNSTPDQGTQFTIALPLHQQSYDKL